MSANSSAMDFQLIPSSSPGLLQLTHLESLLATSSKSYVWKSGLTTEPRKTRAGRIDPNVWERHKEEICQLYVVDDQPLEQVRQQMKHDFSASKHQWTTQLDKWGYVKKASHRRPRPDTMACADSSSRPSRSLPITPGTESFLAKTPSEELKSPETLPVTAQRLAPSQKTRPEAANSFSAQEKAAIGFVGRFQDQTLDAASTKADPKSNSDGDYTRYRKILDIEQGHGRNSRCESLVLGSATDIASSSRSPHYVNSFSPRPIFHSSQSVIPEAGSDALQAMLSVPAPCQIPSFDTAPEISMRSLSLGDEYEGTILRAQKVRPSAKLLDTLFKDPSCPFKSLRMSESDLQGLVGASDFLFAAQSYHESFKICQTLMLSIGQCLVGEHANSAKREPTVWLPVVVQMAKSATTQDDYLEIARMMRRIPSWKGQSVRGKTNAYCMLYAFISSVCLEVANFAQAEKACRESWTNYQGLVEKQALVQHILFVVLSKFQFEVGRKPTSEYTAGKILGRFKGRLTANTSIGVTAKGFGVEPPVISSTIDKHLQKVLIWCVKTMSQQEFFFMVSNIDNAFWNKGVDDHDVVQFERRVIYCYLCERLWHCERSERTKLSNSTSKEVLYSLEEILNHSGLSSMDVLAIVAKVLSIKDEVPRRSRARATLPKRYLQLIETLRQDMIIQNAGYARTGQWLCSNTLLDYYDWPGKPDSHHDRFHDHNYDECVNVFLQEFMSMSLELDLSKRLEQTAECFRKAQASTDNTLLPKSSRSSQISDDYKVFRATAKKIGGDAATSMNHHLELPSAGMEDLMSETSSRRSLFRYSMATGSLKGSDTSLKGGKEKPSSRNSVNMSDRMSFSASSLAKSSIMELD